MPEDILMKSTSGVRGVIGRGLNAELTARYAAAFGTMLNNGKVILGRDSRPSGQMLKGAVIAGLNSVGIDVVDIGIVPTPTVEIAVTAMKAAGGICLTASHNPAQWNALKFFNATGEFITPAEYKRLDRIVTSDRIAHQPHDRLGSTEIALGWVEEHIRRTLAVKFVKKAAIKRRKFTVIVDAINGAGSTALPLLLEKLGCKVVPINCRGDGNFVHEPEPIPDNLGQLKRAVKRHKADLGMACDPDADRLALVDEKGRAIGEELTLAIAVREVLHRRKGTVVINLSTSRVTADIAKAMGARVVYSKVGEANVVQTMHRTKAIVGGEGNGGVIVPSFHAGRDALVAAALCLSHLAGAKRPVSSLVETLPTYYTIKTKAPLPADFRKRLARFEREAGALLGKVKKDRRDGLRLDFREGWVQLRSSNTEPIFRLIVETRDRAMTEKLVRTVRRLMKR